MKTRNIASYIGMAALAAAAELSTTERTHITGGSPGDEATRPIGILIMAEGRSGSSMVGEFFRQDKDVLYFYEPCRKTGDKGVVYGLECLGLVQRLAQCAFTLEDSAGIASDKYAVRAGSPELTTLVDAHGAKQLVKAHEQLVETCTKRRAVAVKSIRLTEGLGDKDYDVSGLKVLHLVRDPRAVVRSMQEHFHMPWTEPGKGKGGKRDRLREGGVRCEVKPLSADDNGWVLRKLSICGIYRTQLDTSNKLEEGRYLLVRYEDIATTPEIAVELMYYWSGLGPPPSNVMEWVDINTKMPACDGDSHRTRHLRASTEANPFGYAYTTPEYPSAIREDDKGVVRAAQTALGIAAPKKSAGSVVSRGFQGSGSGPGGRGNGRHNGRNLAKCFDYATAEQTDVQGTKRDSASMVSMWRTVMPERDAQAVWEGCEASGVMDALGYDL